MPDECSFKLDRREFVGVTGVGLLISMWGQSACSLRGETTTLRARLHIADDGVVTMFTGKVGDQMMLGVWTNGPDECRVFNARLAGPGQLSINVRYTRVHTVRVPGITTAYLTANRTGPIKFKFKK